MKPEIRPMPAGSLHSLTSLTLYSSNSPRHLKSGSRAPGIVWAALLSLTFCETGHAISPVADHFWVYQEDAGAAFGKRVNGYSYGWSSDNSKNAVDRNSPLSQDERYDRSIAMQTGGNHKWEMEVADGKYNVLLVAGDATITDADYRIQVEDKTLLQGKPTAEYPWVSAFGQVEVKDGRLTVANASGARDNRLAYIHVMKVGYLANGAVDINRPHRTAPHVGQPAMLYVQGWLHVAQALPGDVLVVRDAQGRARGRWELKAFENVIAIPGMQAGLYVAELSRAGRNVGSSRFPILSHNP